MAKIALFFLLEHTSLPENFGMKLSTESTASLYDNVMRDISLTKLAYTESTAYCIRLYKKPYNRDVLVIVKDLDYHTGGNLVDSCCKQAAKILEYKGTKPFYHEDYLYRAMWLPRGVQKHEFDTMVNSFSGNADVEAGRLARLNSRGSWIMDHPDGYIFGSKNETDFLRSLVFYSLAMANNHHLSDSLNRLSNAMGTRGDQVEGMLSDIQRFKGSYYFRNPVKPSQRMDYCEYEHLAQRFKFAEIEQMLADKLQAATALLQLSHSGADHSLHHRASKTMKADKRYASTSADSHSEPSSNFSRMLMVAILLVALLAGAAALFLGGDETAQLIRGWFGMIAAVDGGRASSG
ncbi:MAG: hypothetical protein V7739_10740 [Motiliproteus sp.]